MLREVTPSQIIGATMNNSYKSKDLYTSLCIPSTMHTYSLAIEYISNWFYSKFNSDYFKTKNINDHHVLKDFRDFKQINENLKKLKPSVNITPQIQFDTDREKLDLYLSGTNLYTRRSNLEGAFFKDKDKNLFIGIGLEELQVSFNFRMRVSTRAQQIDLFKLLQMSFRIGGTQGEYIDTDFHIPYSLMMQLANDAGFEVKDEKVVDSIGFVHYLNSHSQIPFLFKFRTVNGKNEFFLRFKDVYVHVSCLDNLSPDDGEREGMLTNNYIIEMNAIVKIPTPKFYVYYSETKHEVLKKLESDDDAKAAGIYSVKIPTIPEKNTKGWNVYLTTDCLEEDLTKPLTIGFKELFENTDIGKVIKYNYDMYISPSIFLDFKLFNDGDEVEYTIDWNTLILTSKNSLTSRTTNVIIYTDLAYISERLIELEKMYESRLK